MSELLDRFFFGKAERDRVKQQAHDLERFMQNEKIKREKLIKLEKHCKMLEKQININYLRATYSQYVRFKKGDKDIEVVNYYDENGGTVKITLDPFKTPSENAQRYFQKYQKQKFSCCCRRTNRKTNEEILYFDSLLQQMEVASSKDIEEIREELAEEGYVRNRKTKNAKKKPTKPVLDKYVASDGTEIFVGKTINKMII